MARYVWWCKIHQEIECLDYGTRSRGYTILFINYQKSMEITQNPNNEKYCFLLAKETIEFDRFPTDNYLYNKILYFFLHPFSKSSPRNIYITNYVIIFFSFVFFCLQKKKKHYTVLAVLNLVCFLCNICI